MTTKRFCVLKSSRAFSGQGYKGPSLERAGYRLDYAEFDELDDAKTCALKLLGVNPVGWEVHDSVTKRIVYSTVRDVRNEHT
jgi:hypothetical protein